MPEMLIDGAKFRCAHGQRFSVQAKVMALQVNGKSVLTLNGMLGASITGGCGAPTSSSPVNKPCTNILSVIPGPPMVTIDGDMVLTTEVRGMTDGVNKGSPTTFSTDNAGQNWIVTQ